MTQGTGISPEFVALIERASTETISITLESRALATKMRQRVHSARKQLMRAGERADASPRDRALRELASGVETSIVESEGGVKLLVRPRDSQFLEALKQAGVTAEGAPSPAAGGTPLQEELPLPAPNNDPVMNYLNKKD